MADPTPAAANKWTFLTSVIAAISPILMAFSVGGASVLGVQHLTKKPEQILAADPPRPTPIACEQQFHDLGKTAEAMAADLAAQRKLIEERLPAPRMAPSKVRVWK